jgi:hypothetical protein
MYQSNPHHMVVNKPLNIDDSDLSDNYTPISKPMSQPTEMSYFLQRIRLAEISRRLVDRQNFFAQGGSSEGPTYADLLAIDAELDLFLKEIPSFFRFDRDTNALPHAISNPPISNSPNILIQGYLLTTLIHTQRCKLHLPYLTHPNSNTTYSRSTCLTSARAIIRNETVLENQPSHPFIHSRLKSSGILYGVFMASIVLLGANL